MTDLTASRTADSSIRKRSLSAANGGNPPVHIDNNPVIKTKPLDSPSCSTGSRSPWCMSLTLEKRLFSDNRPISEHGGPTVQDRISSLMSALGAETATNKSAVVAGHAEMEASLKPVSVGGTQIHSASDESRYQSHLQYRGGLSGSILTDSTDSSPTTTISTVDSSMTDSSPSSSPESPTSAGPLSSLNPKQGLDLPRRPEESSLTPPLSPFFGQNVPLSPGRRARNTKNLSLNMAAPTRAAPPPALRIKTASAAHPFQSAPPSPSLVIPDRPPKKRPSKLGLSIQTPATGGLALAASDHVNVVPPTPSYTRPNTLRHHQSSPSLSLFSPTAGIQGGMQLPPFQAQRIGGPFRSQRQGQPHSHQSSFDSACTISEEPSPIVSTSLQELDEEEDYSVPLSQEVKSPAYPSGPVCIYDPHVYLYLEPSDEEASQFDVILNVAREVRNPFRDLSNGQQRDKAQVVVDMRDMELADRPDADVDMATTASTSKVETETLNGSHSVMPSATDAGSMSREPEYIHIPWDHNSNIVDDLLRLVEVIDERVRQGKRVLVHCQCGVSRSASLIVAYGLYKEPSSSVQEVYDAVKKKSRWIGPNMSLIYQLSEFRTKMLKARGLASSNVRSWRGALPGTGRANTIPSDSASSHPLFTSDDAYESGRPIPQTAPLPDERDRTSTRPGSSHNEASLEPVNTDRRGDVTPGPLSAPSGLTWGGSERSTLRKIVTKPPPLALQEPPQRSVGEVLITSKPRDVDHAPEEVPPTPSLMSPRACTFTANPLHEPAMKSVFGFRTSVSVDPRSPAQKGEAPIVRSIFDVL